MDGTPLVIIKQGAWQKEVADTMQSRREDLEAAARESGVRRVEDIDYAILERNGRFSVFGKQS